MNNKILLSFLFVVLSVSPARADKVTDLTNQLEGKNCSFNEDCATRNPVSGVWRRNDQENCLMDAADCLGDMGAEAKPAVPALIDALNKYQNFDTGDGIITIRSAAAEALGKIGDPAAIAPLIEILKSSDPVTRSDAGNFASPQPVERTSHLAVVKALGMFGPKAKEAVAHIIPVLKYSDENYYLKYAPPAAATALGQIKDPSAVPHLLEALENPECDAEAAEALGELGAVEALPVIENKLKNAPENSRFQSSLKSAIKKIKTSGNFKEAVTVSKDDSIDPVTATELADKGYALYKEGKFAGDFKDGHYTDPHEKSGKEFWSDGRKVYIDGNGNGVFESVFRIENDQVIYIGRIGSDAKYVDTGKGFEQYLGKPMNEPFAK